MTPAILASGTDRRASLGLAAAVAVEGAALTGRRDAARRARRGRAAPRPDAARRARPPGGSRRRCGGWGCGARPAVTSATSPSPAAEAVATAVAAAVGDGGRRAGGGPPAGQALGAGARARGPARSAVAACSSRCRPSARSRRSRSRSWSGVGCRARIATRPPGPLAARRALAGARPGGGLSESPGGSRGGCSVWAESRGEPRPDSDAARAGPAGTARRGADPDPRGPGAGGDRWGGHRARPGAAGGGPGRPLGGPQHARRRAAAAGARPAAGRRARTRVTSPAASTSPAPAWRRSTPRGDNRVDPGSPADRLPRRRRQPSAPGPRHVVGRDRSRSGSPAASASGIAARSGWSRAPSRRPRLR